MYLSIISICLLDSSNVLCIWGQDDHNDFFIVDNRNLIYGFASIENIDELVKNDEIPIFPINREVLFRDNELFANESVSYSLEDAKLILLNNTTIDGIDADDARILIELYNLMFDYFYQTNNEECLLLREDWNMGVFFDYCYDRYFWKQGDEWQTLKKNLPLFDYAKFSFIFNRLMNVFDGSIIKYRIKGSA